MPEIIREIKQGDDEWFKLRVGSIGGSTISQAMAKGKNGIRGKTSIDLMYQMAGEILTGEKYEKYPNYSMQRGTELEPEARSTFEFITGMEVEEIALIKGDLDHTHASPDGICSDGGLLEIKCPLAHTQMRRIIEGRTPPEYVQQIQWQLGISGATHCWFFSWHPKFKPLKLKVEPDFKKIAEMLREAKLFIDEMLNLVNKVKMAA